LEEWDWEQEQRAEALAAGLVAVVGEDDDDEEDDDEEDDDEEDDDDLEEKWNQIYTFFLFKTNFKLFIF